MKNWLKEVDFRCIFWRPQFLAMQSWSTWMQTRAFAQVGLGDGWLRVCCLKCRCVYLKSHTLPKTKLSPKKEPLEKEGFYLRNDRTPYKTHPKGSALVGGRAVFWNQTISKRSIAGDLFGLWAFLRNGCLLRMCLKEAQLPKPLTTIGWWMLTLINPILVAGSYHDTGFLPYASYCYILFPFRLRWQHHIHVGVPSPRNHALTCWPAIVTKDTYIK